MLGTFSVFHWIIVFAILAVFITPFWAMFKKAGYPGALSLLLLIPAVNIITIWWFAFSKWPSIRQ